MISISLLALPGCVTLCKSPSLSELQLPCLCNAEDHYCSACLSGSLRGFKGIGKGNGFCKPIGLSKCLYRSHETEVPRVPGPEARLLFQGQVLGVGECSLRVCSHCISASSFKEASGPWGQPGIRDMCLVVSQPLGLLSANGQERLVAVTQKSQQTVVAKGGGGDVHWG